LSNNITAVIVTYNSIHLIPKIISTLSLFAHVVVVDNSTNPTMRVTSQLKEIFPDGTFINSPKNLGYGAGNNLGLDHVKTEYALILNPDLSIDDKNLSAMLNTIQTYPKAMVVGANIYDTRLGKFERSYDWTWKYTPGPNIEPAGDLSAMWLFGCCLLIRKALFESIGRFDEQIFMYYEEFDICKRAVEKGYDVILSKNAVAFHESQSSSIESLKVYFIKTVHWSRSKRIFAMKHGYGNFGCMKRAWFFSYNLLLSGLFTLFFQPKRALKYFAQCISAL
jgi:N-acetylglucosaminyl-diphospho-decaprenol L-rhamnosyltransferase